MKKTIVLGGVTLALFVAGLIFFVNSGAQKTSAVEPEVKIERSSCPFFAENGTCGCVKNGGTCNCGAEKGAGTCMNNGVNRENPTPKRAGCGCQNQSNNQQ